MQQDNFSEDFKETSKSSTCHRSYYPNPSPHPSSSSEPEKRNGKKLTCICREMS